MEINNENSEGSQDNIYKSSEEEEENKNQNNALYNADYKSEINFSIYYYLILVDLNDYNL